MKNDIVLVPYEETDGMIFCGYFEGHLLLKNGNPLLSRTHKQPYRIYHANGISQAMAASETQGRYFVMEDMADQKESRTDKVIYDGHLDIKGWHHKACEVISPNGICTCCHCQSNNLLQKITENMADQNAIELPSELKGKKFRIRKLTPRECFRLMGVDDKDIDKMQAAGISQSGQYKLAGNSIVVDVLFHIFRKMFIETDQDFDGTPTQLTLF